MFFGGCFPVNSVNPIPTHPIWPQHLFGQSGTWIYQAGRVGQPDSDTIEEWHKNGRETLRFIGNAAGQC